MRNLKLQCCKEDTTGIINAKQLLLHPHTEHNETQITYVVTDDKIYAFPEPGDNEEKPTIIAELPDIVSAELLQLQNAICVATGAGEVLHIDPDTLSTTEGTYCDVGIECMEWSPSQEVVAFVTKAKHVVVMTWNYEVLSEQPLDAELAAEQQFVNVGWGKKETQFHGSAGKQAAKQSATFQPPKDEEVEQLPKDVHIAWRGDGSYFAVSYVAGNVGRTFSVYDNEGKLQHLAEKWNGLQSPLTWRPSGNWIAVPQIFSDKTKSNSTVSLFEKNGLRHREFELPFELSSESIVKLQWSSDSDILALQTCTPEAQRIYLYTIGNYHWYLKQVLVYGQDKQDALAFFQWSSERTLHVLLKSGKRYVYRWNFDVDRFNNIACVIDGKSVLLTDLHKAVVPPPMCSRTLTTEFYVNGITTTNNQLILYDSCSMRFYCASEQSLVKEEQQLHASLETGQVANLMKLRGVDNKFIATRSVGNKTQLLLLGNKDAKECFKVENSLVINGTVNALSEGNDRSIYVHTINNGHIHKLSYADSQLLPGVVVQQLMQPADYMSSAAGLVTLRSQQLLHLDGQRIDEDVTSFIETEKHLIYTQLNELHFVDLLQRRKVSSRSIERGAKLVMHAPDARLVLQLPRGNLEVIFPRVLLLQQIGILLSASKYADAMRMVRKHRINLNIICDHDVRLFCSKLQHFLDEIKDPQWLCLFLSELQNEDYTLTMYSSNYEASQQLYPADYQVDRKVAYICGLLCNHMERETNPEDLKRFRLPIITSYVKLGQLEQALLLIWKQKQTDAQLAEQCLKYLLYLVDVNELYNVALGTYDFGLVLFVAQNSQKDPKEFLPFLNELNTLPLDYRKFKIDEHLKRYERALAHLSACGDAHVDQALEFIKQHNLYSKALIIYKNQPDVYRRICLTYADHLRANAQLVEASFMYERGGQYQQALLSARHTLDCQRVLNLAQRAGESLEQVANSLVTPLEQQDRHLEAFELLKQFTKWTDEPPLQVLIDGHHYCRAIYEARLLAEDRTVQILADRIKPALIAFVEQLKLSLNTDRDWYVTHKARLLDIRKKQAALEVNGGDGAGDHEVDIDEVDLLSDTSSMNSSRYSNSSRGTGKTFRSSKNRRKHERKLLSMKPGNPFEDIAIIDALHNHVTKIANQKQQQLVRDTCKALLQLQTEDERAAELQQLYGSVLAVLQTTLDEIWIPELMGGTAQHLTGPNIDYQALRKEQRYALISPLKRFKPQLTIIDWQHSILQ